MESRSENSKENINWTKLRGVYGQVKNLIAWESSTDGIAQNYYKKFESKPKLLEKCKEFKDKLEKAIEHNQHTGIIDENYTRLSGEWDQILNELESK